eukprot:295153-Hanusia_phi.AAC.1
MSFRRTAVESRLMNNLEFPTKHLLQSALTLQADARDWETRGKKTEPGEGGRRGRGRKWREGGREGGRE